MNSNIFSFDRFGKYFCYDLRSAYNRFGLSALILGSIPVFTFVTSQLISLLVSREFTNLGSGPQISAFVTAICIVVLMAPVKLYGHVTDRRAGSDWLMIPASALEKTLSMLLITCVVVPAVFFSLFFLTDGIIAVLFGKIYPNAMITEVGRFSKVLTDNGFITISKVPFYLSWCENILIFTLGSIFFKRGKIGKTILSYFIFISLLTTVLGLIIPGIDIDNATIREWVENLTAEKVQFWLNFFLNILYLVVFALLDLGIYFRIKTIRL